MKNNSERKRASAMESKSYNQKPNVIDKKYITRENTGYTREKFQYKNKIGNLYSLSLRKMLN